MQLHCSRKKKKKEEDKTTHTKPTSQQKKTNTNPQQPQKLVFLFPGTSLAWHCISQPTTWLICNRGAHQENYHWAALHQHHLPQTFLCFTWWFTHSDPSSTQPTRTHSLWKGHSNFWGVYDKSKCKTQFIWLGIVTHSLNLMKRSINTVL